VTIIESLSRGRPVLASDLPVHKEVGGSYASYFRDAAAAIAIAAHADGALAPAAPLDRFRWPTWHECTADLLSKALRLASSDAARSAA
jgi:hypothetical protein